MLLFIFLLEVSPFFIGNNPISQVILILIFISLNFKRLQKHDRKLIKILFVFFLVAYIQYFTENGRSALAPLVIAIKIFILPFFIVRTYGHSFLDYFYQLIYYICLFTFPIYILQVIDPVFDFWIKSQAIEVYNTFDLKDRFPRALLVYTVSYMNFQGEVAPTFSHSYLGFYRNCSLFHEPGALGFWVNFVMAIAVIKGESLFNKKNLFLLLVVLTTFSTTAYFQSLILILSVFVFKLKRLHWVPKTFVLTSFLSITILLYFTLPFLRNKIIDRINIEASTDLEKLETADRIATTRRTLNAFLQNPVIGTGIAQSDDKAEDKFATDFVANNSLGVLAKYGIVLGIIYFITIFKSLKLISEYSGIKNNNKFLFLILLMFILGGLGQSFVNTMFFNVLFVIPFLFSTNLLSNKRGK